MAKPYATLIPSIERRESAWVKLRERLAHAPTAPNPPSVTISRQYGCEGYALAQCLKERLDAVSNHTWTVFDKTLLDRVASDEKLSRLLLDHLGDESHAQDVLRTHFGYSTHDDAYAKLAKHLLQIATAGYAIIVGRGGAVVCQDLKPCFHLRLVGSFEFRAMTLARRLELPLKEAEEQVRTQSKLREGFISHCLREDITSPRWYDAIFNNERQSVEAIAQACLGLILGGDPDPRHFKRDILEASTTKR